MQRITYICDECDEEFDCDPGLDLKDAWQQAKDDGWICFKAGDEWKHKCGECEGR